MTKKRKKKQNKAKSRKKSRKAKSRKKSRKAKSRKKSRKAKSRKKSRKAKSRKKSRKTKSIKKSRKAKPIKSTKKNNKELIFKVPRRWSKAAYVDKKKYEQKYKNSIKDNDSFWKKEGKRIDWIKPYKRIKDVKYSSSDVKIKWFYDGTLNASSNCIDRHLVNKKNKTAIIWVGDDPNESKHISYQELHKNVCRAANGLKALGIKKGGGGGGG